MSWIHCPNCGHRLFFNKGGSFLIEIKCTSCKRIMTIDENTIGGDRKHETNGNSTAGSSAGNSTR